LESFKTKESDSLKLYFKDLGPQVGWTTVSFNFELGKKKKNYIKLF
jgi:hypothetical protein